jgi:hypothetical protein
VFFDGKNYGTAAYYSDLKRNNSIVQLSSGEVFKIDFIFQIDKLCKSDHDEDAIFCRMSVKRFFQYGNVIIIGTKLNLIFLVPVKERYANNINLTSFIKKIDSSVRNIDTRRRVQVKAFFPKDILYKGILIKAENEIYCIIKNVKLKNS